MKRYSQGTLVHPGRTLIVWFAIIALAAFAIAVLPQLHMNPTFSSMIMPDDPDRAADRRAKELFGSDEMITIAVEDPRGVFNIPTLTLIDELTRQVEAIPGVRQVYSLARVDNIRGKDGILYTDDLITELPATAEDVARIEREAFANPIYVANIVAADKQVASINVELELASTTSEAHAAITKQIYALVERVSATRPPGVNLYVTGYPVGSYVGGLYMIQDMVVFGGVSMLVLMIVTWLVFRCWQGVVGTMLVVMASVAVSYGAMSVLGVPVTMPLSAVMVFLTALGMQYSTYVAFSHREQVYRERSYPRPVPKDPRFVLSEALRGVNGSVVLAAVTTAIGFGSMYVNRVPDLQKMGCFLVIGLVVTAVAVMTILPAIFALFPFEVPAADRHHVRLQRGIDAIGGFATRRPHLMLVAAALLFGAGVVGLTQLDTNTDAMSYFKRSSEIRKSEDFVRARMAGTTYLQAVITADAIDAFKDPANLRKLEAIQRFTEGLPHVTKTVSHADHLSLMNQALHDGTAAQYHLPDTRAAVEQYLLLHNEPTDFRLWIDADYQNASVMIRMNTMASSVQRVTEEKLEAFMKTQFPTWTVNLVGTNLLTHRAFDEMAESMLKSIGIATLLIWLVMIIGLGSFKLGTLSLIPNLAPSIIIYAVLPLIGQPLDPPTAVTGAVALGILADDTVHFFKTWLSFRRDRANDAASAVTKTLSEIGKPMVLSSVILAIGFSIMMLSRYGTLVWTGIMMVIVTSTALVWELVCTPAMLRLVAPKPRKAVADEGVGDFRKLTADEKRPRFADYSDAEIMNLNTADFLALAGKTVIRHGGSNGTRRLLVELDIRPGMRVLEVGAGVGATAFTIVQRDPTVHVTGVDLSAFMLDKSRARAAELGVADRIDFVLSADPNRLPFDNDSFDIVVAESVAMYNQTSPFFAEALRVLKPGGRIGLHDWCWTETPTAALEVQTCVLACGCNPGDVKFFTQSDWEASLTSQGFQLGFAESYPFTFFSWSSMADDEGTWGLLKMFGRVLSRRATAKRMVRMMMFLARQEGMFGYTVTIAQKPA